MFCRNTLCTGIKIVCVKRLSCQVSTKSKQGVVRILAIVCLLYKFLTGEEINPFICQQQNTELFELFLGRVAPAKLVDSFCRVDPLSIVIPYYFSITITW